MNENKVYAAQARQALKGKRLAAVLLMAVFTLVLQLPNGIQELLEAYFRVPDDLVSLRSVALTLVSTWILLPLSAFVDPGQYAYGERVLAGERPSLSMLFPKGVCRRALAALFVLSLLTTLPRLPAALALEFIGKSPAYDLLSLAELMAALVITMAFSMATYLLLHHPEIGPMEALRESRKRMKGYKWRLFRLTLRYVGWLILGYIAIRIFGGALEEMMDDNLAEIFEKLAHFVLLCAVTAHDAVATTAFFRDLEGLKK